MKLAAIFLAVSFSSPVVHASVLDLIPPVNAIIGGNDVLSGDPVARSTVGVLLPNSLCTGTLLEPDVVVTAGHCVMAGREAGYAVFDPSEVTISFGTNLFSQTRIGARAVLRHPYFARSRDGTDDSDVAVILLRSPAPKPYEPARWIDDSRPLIRERATVIAAGFGITRANERGLSASTSRLKKIPLRAAGFQGQTEALLDQRDGTGVCHGDSGGPIYVNQNGTLLYWGIVSRPARSNREGDHCDGFTVVSRVDAHRPWIRQAIERMRGRANFGRDSGGQREPLAQPSDSGE